MKCPNSKFVVGVEENDILSFQMQISYYEIQNHQNAWGHNIKKEKKHKQDGIKKELKTKTDKYTLNHIQNESQI